MQVPSRAELERWFDADSADDVHFVETVTSWPSLRVLDYLYACEPATTGDIARTLNMDMRDVKDRLDALESHNAVEETDDGWQTTTDRISIVLTQNSGLEITYSLGDEEKRDAEHLDQQHAGETDGSVITRVRQRITSLFR